MIIAAIVGVYLGAVGIGVFVRARSRGRWGKSSGEEATGPKSGTLTPEQNKTWAEQLRQAESEARAWQLERLGATATRHNDLGARDKPIGRDGDNAGFVPPRNAYELPTVSELEFPGEEEAVSERLALQRVASSPEVPTSRNPPASSIETLELVGDGEEQGLPLLWEP